MVDFEQVSVYWVAVFRHFFEDLFTLLCLINNTLKLCYTTLTLLSKNFIWMCFICFAVSVVDIFLLGYNSNCVVGLTLKIIFLSLKFFYCFEYRKKMKRFFKLLKTKYFFKL